MIGAGLTVVNMGTIGTSGQAADAIAFISGNNTLILGAGGVQGVLNGAIGITGTLIIQPNTDQSLSATLANLIQNDTGAGSVVVGGAGKLTLTAANTYTGGTTINVGALEIGSAGAAGTGAITFAGSTGEKLQIDAALASGSTYGQHAEPGARERRARPARPRLCERDRLGLWLDADGDEQRRLKQVHADRLRGDGAVGRERRCRRHAGDLRQHRCAGGDGGDGDGPLRRSGYGHRRHVRHGARCTATATPNGGTLSITSVAGCGSGAGGRGGEHLHHQTPRR